MKMEKEQRIELIMEYAKKLLQYPKDSKGYEPVDALCLKLHLDRYESENNSTYYDDEILRNLILVREYPSFADDEYRKQVMEMSQVVVERAIGELQ